MKELQESSSLRRFYTAKEANSDKYSGAEFLVSPLCGFRCKAYFAPFLSRGCDRVGAFLWLFSCALV